MTSVLGDSVRVMPRTATVTVPYMTALISANSAPKVKELAPGLVTINTPMKPMASAPPRTQPAGSLSQTIDTSSGEQRRREIDGHRAGKRHQAEGEQERKLRDRLRQPAREMIARPARRIDRQAGDRQDHRSAADQCRPASAETAPRRPGIPPPAICWRPRRRRTARWRRSSGECRTAHCRRGRPSLWAARACPAIEPPARRASLVTSSIPARAVHDATFVAV